MKQKISFYAINLFFLLVAFSIAAPQGVYAVNLSEWELTFSDEFNGPSLNRNVWGTTYPWGARTLTGNAEGQWYLDNNFIFENGILKLVAKKDYPRQGFDYSSGMISSHLGFYQTYGYFEMRAKLPKGKGMWPAFWMLQYRSDWPWPPEVDIIESWGDRPTWVQFNTHGISNCVTGSYTGPNFTDGFHTFGFEWAPNTMVWYVDDVERHRCGGILNVPMYFLITLAVGGSWPGYPDSNTPFPGYLEIDYFRAYKKKSSTTPTPTLQPTPTPTLSGPTPTPSPVCRADVNKNGRVEVGDISGILFDWGKTCSGTEIACRSDVNRNGRIEVGDIAGVLFYWGQSCQ